MPARGDDGPGPVNATVASLVHHLRAPLSAGFTVMRTGESIIEDGGAPLLARRDRDKCQDTGSRFLGQCQRTDWIGLWWAMLRRPLARPGVLMVASGGHPSSHLCQSASTRSIHMEPQPLGCF